MKFQKEYEHIPNIFRNKFQINLIILLKLCIAVCIRPMCLDFIFFEEKSFLYSFYFISRIFSLLSTRGSATAVTNCFLCNSGRNFYILLANTLTMNSTKVKKSYWSCSEIPGTTKSDFKPETETGPILRLQPLCYVNYNNNKYSEHFCSFSNSELKYLFFLQNQHHDSVWWKMLSRIQARRTWRVRSFGMNCFKLIIIISFEWNLR